MEQQAPYPDEVKVLAVGRRQFTIVGTAHISRRSAELVRRVIENEKPDAVGVRPLRRRAKPGRLLEGVTNARRPA